MEALPHHQALRFKENLTLPSVQVIVMNANMRCSHCRQRVSLMMSKISGLLDYVVDVGNKEVKMRGLVDLKTRQGLLEFKSKGSKQRKSSFSCFSPFFRA